MEFRRVTSLAVKKTRLKTLYIFRIRFVGKNLVATGRSIGGKPSNRPCRERRSCFLMTWLVENKKQKKPCVLPDFQMSGELSHQKNTNRWRENSTRGRSKPSKNRKRKTEKKGEKKPRATRFDVTRSFFTLSAAGSARENDRKTTKRSNVRASRENRKPTRHRVRPPVRARLCLRDWPRFSRTPTIINGERRPTTDTLADRRRDVAVLACSVFPSIPVTPPPAGRLYAGPHCVVPYLHKHNSSPF